jgi:hypothetical protein
MLISEFGTITGITVITIIITVRSGIILRGCTTGSGKDGSEPLIHVLNSGVKVQPIMPGQTRTGMRGCAAAQP